MLVLGLLLFATAQPSLTLVLADGKVVVIDQKAWNALPQVEVTAQEKDGSAHRFGGVKVDVLLARFGVALGEALRGPALANAVILDANDGYRVVLGVGEVDEATSGRAMLLARSRDGAPLPTDRAPLQLVIPGDTRHGRWIRQVTRVEVLALPAPAPATTPSLAPAQKSGSP